MSRKVLKNFFSLAILHVASYAVPIITVPYLTRVLGAVGFGNLAIAQAMVQYFILLVDYGFNLSSSRAVAASVEDPLRISEVFWSTLYTKGCLVALSGGILLLCGMLPVVEHLRPVIWGSFAAVLGTWLFPTWFFQGLQRMTAISIINLVARIMALPLLMIFVRGPADLPLAALIIGMTALFGGVLGFLVALRLGVAPPPKFKASAITGRIVEGWPLFLSSAGTSLYWASNIILLRAVASPEQVGFFAGADKIRIAAIGLIPQMTSAFFPTSVASSHGASRSLQGEILRYVPKLVLGLGIFIVLFFGAAPLAAIGLGRSMAPSSETLRIFAFLGLIIPFNHILGVHVLVARGYSKQFSRSVLIGGASNFILLPLLGGIFGANGAAAALVLVEIMVLVALLLSCKHIGVFHLAPLDVTGST
jgi:polysaccharide transporter, PST family